MSTPAARQKELDRQHEAAAANEAHRQEIADKVSGMSVEYRAKNVYEALLMLGHDEDFVPPNTPESTGARPGTREKLDVLAARVAAGEELWHPDDENCLPNATERIPHGEHGPKNYYIPSGMALVDPEEDCVL